MRENPYVRKGGVPLGDWVAHRFSGGGYELDQRSNPPPLKRWVTRPTADAALVCFVGRYRRARRRRRGGCTECRDQVTLQRLESHALGMQTKRKPHE